jgi:hypothetical protein
VPTFEDVLHIVRDRGLLLASDADLLSVSQLVLGGPLKGSWWGHPKGRAIWLITERLADHPDVVVLRLVKRKVTYVHRRLWPAVYAIGRSNEPWQLRGLSSTARTTMARVQRMGSIRSDQLSDKRIGWSHAVADLEKRLLLVSHEVHTETGSHAKLVESWEHWAQRCDVNASEEVEQARSQLERATRGLGPSRTELLPWARASQ